MKKMNRSFVCGIIVASTTWCFSLYLYWMLTTKNTTEISPSGFQWSPNDSQQYVVLKHKNIPNELNQLIDDKKQQQVQEQKDNLYKKYKKERKFRKIPQRLRNELKPIQENAGPGKTDLIAFYFSFAFIFNNAFFSDEFGMVQNAEEQLLRDIGYKRHAFNILVSSKIGLTRDIPDTRNKL